MRLLTILLAFGFAALQPGVRDGRAGNRLLDAGHALDAAAAYQAGLARAGVPDDVAARLWHNLGVALVRADSVAGSAPPADSASVSADSAFAEALRLADDPAQRARYATDAGTAALLGGELERAVGLLRRALVLDPSSTAARRNYEIARRRLDARQPPPPTPEPSEDARRLKARADALLAERRYREALDLMTAGLARDSTVAAYAEFVGRLGGVVEIEEAPSEEAPIQEGPASETSRPGASVPPSAGPSPDRFR